MSAVEFEWQVPSEFNFAVDVVDAWARDPDRLALVAVDESGNEQTYTYADIAAASCRLANLLKVQGLRKGDRVLVMLPRIVTGRSPWLRLCVSCCPHSLYTMLTPKDSPTH